MATPAVLAVGERLLLADPAIRWNVQFSDTNPPSVVLTALIEAGPKPPIFPPPYGETSVAVQMDARVAIGLLRAAWRLNPLHGLAAAHIRRTPNLNAFQRRFGGARAPDMFASAKQKIERADHHIADLERQFAIFVAEKPHRFSVKADLHPALLVSEFVFSKNCLALLPR